MVSASVRGFRLLKLIRLVKSIKLIKSIKAIEFTPDEGATLPQAKAAAKELGEAVRQQLGQDEKIEMHFRLGNHNYDLTI